MKKFRIYRASKKDKADKYLKDLEKHYDLNHVDGESWIRCYPVNTWDGKIAVTLLLPDTEPPDPDAYETVDNIDPPVMEEP